MRTLALSLFLAAITLPSTPAAACWDGHLAVVGGVTMSSGGTSWSPERARELATWLSRIDALLSAGATLDIQFGYARLCSGGDRTGEEGTCTEWQWDERSLAALFRDVAQRTRASEDLVRTARATRRDVHVIQIAAFRDRAQAEALAVRLADTGIGEHGFYQAGGFPADNPVAHVLTMADASGRAVHRVVVGAFVERSQAERVREALDGELGVRGIVRAL